MKPIDVADYRQMRSRRLARLTQIKKMGAPDIVIKNEQVLLLQARMFRSKPAKAFDTIQKISLELREEKRRALH